MAQSEMNFKKLILEGFNFTTCQKAVFSKEEPAFLIGKNKIDRGNFLKIQKIIKLRNGFAANADETRNNKIMKITPHHAAGNLSVEAIGKLFQNAGRNASANYGIGSDGRIGSYVPEESRAWTSSSAANDNQAITIEVANNGGAPNWPISDAAWNSLINLCVDICKRYGFKLTYDGTPNGSLTRHNMFAATLCPGPTLQGKFPELVKLVNSRLDGTNTPSGQLFKVQIGAFSTKANAEKQLQKAKNSGFGDAFLILSGGLFKVQIGAFSLKSNAEKRLQEAKKANYFDAFITN